MISIIWTHTVKSLRLKTKYLRETIDKITQENRHLENKVRQLNLQIQNLNDIFTWTTELIPQTTHKGYPVIIYAKKYTDSKVYAIYMYGVIEGGLVLGSTATISNGTMYIEDLNVAQGSHKGYGTLSINTMLAYARSNNIERLTGDLYCGDQSTQKDQDRLITFYRKMGFTILPANDMKYGKIIMELKKGVL